MLTFNNQLLLLTNNQQNFKSLKNCYEGQKPVKVNVKLFFMTKQVICFLTMVTKLKYS